MTGAEEETQTCSSLLRTMNQRHGFKNEAGR